MSRRAFSALILILFIQKSVFACSNRIWPVPNWQVADLAENVGMSSSKLNEYIRWLSSKAKGEPFGTIVVRYGKVVCEYYDSGATACSKWEIGSIRKPVGSTLLGIAIEEGKLTLEQIVYDIWPEIYLQTGKDKDKKIRVEHLFNSSSGWKRAEFPGTKWVYNNSAFTAGGMAIGRVYKVPEDKIAPLAKTRIADKIGARDWDCYHYPNDFSSSAGNPGPKLAIDSNMRDLARFGYLWLRQGQWNGRQIIPKSYVKLATQNHVTQLKRHYGFCWFVNDGSVVLPNAPEDAYFHIGNGKDNRRTVLVVIPSLDLVAVVGTHGSTYNITDGYKSEPVPHVNEWIGKIIESIQDAPVASEKVAAKGRFGDIAAQTDAQRLLRGTDSHCISWNRSKSALEIARLQKCMWG
jgi:CubicO group peptidase (beta-lactamase class C family)